MVISHPGQDIKCSDNLIQKNDMLTAINNASTFSEVMEKLKFMFAKISVRIIHWIDTCNFFGHV